MAQARLCRTDLAPKDRKAIQVAVSVLYSRLVKGVEDKKRSRATRWADFARALKASLDQNKEPHWHVLVGTSVGFACKKRNKTMAVFRIDDCMVVLWKSPGIEEVNGVTDTGADQAVDSAGDGECKAVPEEGEGEGEVESKAAGSRAGGSSASNVRVMQPSEVEAGSSEEGVIKVLQEELRHPPADLQELAQGVRRRLTADFGTVWHVVAGADFVIEAAENRRNFVMVTVGKIRVVCFQHEQFGGGLASLFSWQKVLAVMPYLLVVGLILGYTVLSSLCKERDVPPDKKIALWLQQRLCSDDWEHNLGLVGVVAMAVVMVVRKRDMMLARKAA